MFGHNHDFPIGTWENLRIIGKRLIGDLRLAKQGTSDRIDEIRSLIEQRVLKAVSVGLRVKEYEPIEKGDPFGPWEIKSQELLETSVVSVPANAEALSVAKSLGVSRDVQDLAFGRMNAGLEPVERRLKARDPKQLRSYEDLIGTPSDIVRTRRKLKQKGLL